MNKLFNFLLLLAFSFVASQTLNAQAADGTDDDGFVISLTSPAFGALALYNGQPCGWEGSVYGPSLTADQAFCGELAWGHDSLGCTPLTDDLTGKIAVLRRGVCNFSLKVFNAQAAGAIACIIVTHYSTATEGPCTLSLGAMSGGDSATSIVIPNVIIHRQTGEAIDAAFAAGQPVTACFTFPRMLSPTSASMYATPLAHVAPMQAMTLVYNNRSGATENDVTMKAEVFDPTGAKHGEVTYSMPVVEPGVDSFVVFPEYDAPAMKGKWSVLYTNSLHSEALDSLYSYFEHTDYTFATDDLVVDPGGVGPTDADFATNGFYIQSGGLTLTGDVPARATYATFGVSNIEAVYVPGDPAANIIGVAVYKADVDGDGAGDLSASFVDDLSAGLLSYNEYEMTGNEVNDSLINVELIDINTNLPGIDLEANSAYYISLIYDGTASGAGICVRFMNSKDPGYASFDGYPTTPLYFGSLFTGGWSGAIVMERIQLDGYVPGVKTAEPKTLDASKVTITPNPANEYVNVGFSLEGVNPSVAVSILDEKGRVVIGSQVVKNIQNGVMNFDAKQLPSGVYYAWIRTAEGSTMKPVSVCH